MPSLSIRASACTSRHDVRLAYRQRIGPAAACWTPVQPKHSRMWLLLVMQHQATGDGTRFCLRKWEKAAVSAVCSGNEVTTGRLPKGTLQRKRWGKLLSHFFALGSQNSLAPSARPFGSTTESVLAQSPVIHVPRTSHITVHLRGHALFLPPAMSFKVRPSQVVVYPSTVAIGCAHVPHPPPASPGAPHPQPSGSVRLA